MLKEIPLNWIECLREEGILTLSDRTANYSCTQSRAFSCGSARQDACAITTAQSRLQSPLQVAGKVVIIISGG